MKRPGRWRKVFLGAGAALLLGEAMEGAAINCTITAVGVSFGAYDVFSSSPRDSTGSVTTSCTGIKPADRITIDLSKGGAASFSLRRMVRAGGAETLSFNLYLDAARTTIWGDATSGTSHYGPAAPHATDTITIYGRIPAGQDAPAGTYAETIVATINF